MSIQLVNILLSNWVLVRAPPVRMGDLFWNRTTLLNGYSLVTGNFGASIIAKFFTSILMHRLLSFEEHTQRSLMFCLILQGFFSRCTDRYSLCKGAQLVKVKDVICKCGRKILNISYKVGSFLLPCVLFSRTLL